MLARIPPSAIGTSLARKLSRDPEARSASMPDGKAKADRKLSNTTADRYAKSEREIIADALALIS